MAKKNVLGRGLDALIDRSNQIDTQGSSQMNEIPVEQIQANPFQPRTIFDEGALQELADSIKEVGIIQPVTVRMISDGNYQLISGERRFRAAILSKLPTVPAYIRTAEDEQVMEMALIENIQREDLDAIEIALSYQRLIDEYGLTQGKLSERVGKKRATVANYLRLLRLPAEVQLGLRNRKIQMGHARALVSLESPKDQLSIYAELLKEGLSVRKVEELVQQASNPVAEEKGTLTKETPSAKYMKNAVLKKELTSKLGVKVDVYQTEEGQGKINMTCSSPEEFSKVIDLIRQL